MTITTADFLEQMKAKCQAKAKQMAKLEIENMGTTYDNELKSNYGFTDKSLAARKKQLHLTANS
jgi:hypothetical protein